MEEEEGRQGKAEVGWWKVDGEGWRCCNVEDCISTWMVGGAVVVSMQREVMVMLMRRML